MEINPTQRRMALNLVRSERFRYALSGEQASLLVAIGNDFLTRDELIEIGHRMRDDETMTISEAIGEVLSEIGEQFGGKDVRGR